MVEQRRHGPLRSRTRFHKTGMKDGACRARTRGDSEAGCFVLQRQLIFAILFGPAFRAVQKPARSWCSSAHRAHGSSNGTHAGKFLSMCGIACMPTERTRPMTILDPISGNRVTISASGKPRGRSIESGLEVRHVVLPSVAETKEGRHEPEPRAKPRRLPDRRREFCRLIDRRAQPSRRIVAPIYDRTDDTASLVRDRVRCPAK